MPKKKKKKKKKKSPSSARFKQDIIGIALISLALFIFMSNVTTSTGVVGFYMVDQFLKPAVGVGVYLLPYFLAFFGIVIMLRQQAIFLTYQVAGIFLLFFTIVAQAQLYSDKYFNKIISSTSGAGGVIGYIVKNGLEGAVGNVGAYIVLSSAFIISIVLIFNITLANMLSKLWDYIFSGKRMKRKKKSIADDGHRSIPSMMPIIKEINAIKDEFEEEDKPQKKIELRSPKAKPISRPRTTKRIGKYQLPSLDLLDQPTEREKQRAEKLKETVEIRKKALEETLKSFGVGAKVVAVHQGPAVTRYEVQPDPGVKVSKIANLADDISLGLASQGVRIEAPIPGKAAVGIEVPNPATLAVKLGEIAHTKEFDTNASKLFIGLGKNLSGSPVFGDLSKMPHLLIAGTTGSGKSVCINSLLMSLLLRARPDEVKFLMIDPKMVEFTHYNDIPHLLAPVVTDPKKAAQMLKGWVIKEMDRRYKTFYAAGVRNITAFNKKIDQGKAQPASRKFETEEYAHERMPYIIVIIDELADLMMVAANEVETTICRIAQLARATGIHLVVATQRPSVDVITGLIKANIPSRIAFAVATQVDSRVILDMSGAEKLLGRGDMLYHPVGAMKPTRLQGAFVSDDEIEKVTEFIKNQAQPEYSEEIMDLEAMVEAGGGGNGDGGNRDDLFAEAVKIIIGSGQASTSHLQRRLRIGYNRAARLMDEMEAAGIVSALENDNKPRKIIASSDMLKSLGIK
ncbi:DNA translocase FtsK 4TM domain-containing protein [Candidatus Margulisiibacteriota bacterium]